MASKKAGRLAGLAALAGLAYMANKKGEGKTPDAVKSESKSKSYDRDTDTGVDAMASDAAKKPAVDLGEIRDEEGRLSTLRRNTETGETYDPIGSSSGKSAATKVAAPAKTSSASTASQTGRFAPSGSPVLSDNPRKIGNAKAVVAQGGDRSARADMSSPSQTKRFAPSGSPVLSDNPRKIGNAKAVVAQGGDRSARADMSSPSSGSGSGGRTPRSDAPSSGLGGVRRPGTNVDYENENTYDMSTGKRGGVVKKMASGGMTSSASKRADGIATKGKTRGRMC